MHARSHLAPASVPIHCILYAPHAVLNEVRGGSDCICLYSYALQLIAHKSSKVKGAPRARSLALVFYLMRVHVRAQVNYASARLIDGCIAG
jgi:hypothetical protein